MSLSEAEIKRLRGIFDNPLMSSLTLWQLEVLKHVICGGEIYTVFDRKLGRITRCTCEEDHAV